jgi:predicted regulator of Ras-like GTPase activity (Roadblock/LC7/MglB family)
LEYTLVQNQLDKIEKVLEKDFIGIGVHCVCMIDLAGNVLASLDNGKIEFDVYTLAALSAGNFGAVNAIAKVIGEEEFSLLFHKGKRESIHFSRILADFLLVVIFGKETSLGFLRLKAGEATSKIKKILMS